MSQPKLHETLVTQPGLDSTGLLSVLYSIAVPCCFFILANITVVIPRVYAERTIRISVFKEQ